MKIQRWEYNTLGMTGAESGADERRLDYCGREGWELVAVVHTPNVGTVAYLKRPIQEDEDDA